MSTRQQQRGERQLLSAARLYRKGRVRVLWVNGVLYFGGSLFLLYNAVDYLIEPRSRPLERRVALWRHACPRISFVSCRVLA